MQTLDEATALRLLEQELGDEAARLEPAQAQTLVRELGYLPLAVHLAAGHLRASHSVESFLALLKKKGLELEPAHSNDRLFTEDQARAIIRRTFELSLEVLRRQLDGRDEAGRWLAGLAALGHAPLSGFGQSLGAAIAEISGQAFGVGRGRDVSLSWPGCPFRSERTMPGVSTRCWRSCCVPCRDPSLAWRE